VEPVGYHPACPPKPGNNQDQTYLYYFEDLKLEIEFAVLLQTIQQDSGRGTIMRSKGVVGVSFWGRNLASMNVGDVDFGVDADDGNHLIYSLPLAQER
jgi:hypothetical protein